MARTRVSLAGEEGDYRQGLKDKLGKVFREGRQEAVGESGVTMKYDTDLSAESVAEFHIHLFARREFNPGGGGRDSEAVAEITKDGETRTENPEFKATNRVQPYDTEVSTAETLNPVTDERKFNEFAFVRYEAIARPGYAIAPKQPSQDRPRIPEHVGEQAVLVECGATIASDPRLLDVEEGIMVP